MSTTIGLIIGGIGATFLSVSFPEVAVQVNDGVLRIVTLLTDASGAIQ